MRGEAQTKQREVLFSVMKLHYIRRVPSGTIAINSRVISGSDPGAVPGGSTKKNLGGRNRIDGRLKMFAFTRRDATVIGTNCIIANDDYAPVAVAA